MEGREEASEPGEAEAWDSGASRGEGRCKSAHSETTGRASEEPQGVACRSQLFASVSSGHCGTAASRPLGMGKGFGWQEKKGQVPGLG